MNVAGERTGKENGQRSSSGTAGRFYLVAMGVVLALVGTVFSIALWKGYRQAGETLRWKETSCEIVSAWIAEGRFSEAGDRRYRLELRYRYRFGDREYVGDRLGRRDGETRYRAKLQRVLREYPPGTRTRCYVDPAHPEIAVLRHETRAPGYTLWFPLLFVAGGAVMAWTAARRTGNAGRGGRDL